LFQDWLIRFPGQKRKYLLFAREKLIDSGVVGDEIDFTYNVFGKLEKTLSVIRHKVRNPKKPRAVYGASDAAKLIGGPWFLQYGRVMKSVWNCEHDVYYASGVTNDDMTNWVRRACSRFPDPMFLYSDFSMYDVTQGEECIKAENRWYKALGFGIDESERAYLKSKLYSRLQFGPISLRTKGVRKSGDNDTSSGNTRCTVLIILYFLHQLGLKKGEYCLAVLGDDNITIISSKAARRLKLTNVIVQKVGMEIASELGVKIKIGYTGQMTRAEFLSKRIYDSDTGPYFGCKPGRLICKVGWFLSKPNVYNQLEIFHGTLISLKPVMENVPFARVYLNLCLQWLQEQNVSVSKPKNKYQAERSFGVLGSLDFQTWVKFEEVYGMSIFDEALFELEFKQALKQYGIPFIFHSEYLDQLLKVDQAAF